LIAGTSTSGTLACRRPLPDEALEPAIENRTCVISSVQVTFGVAGKVGHRVGVALEERLTDPEEANHSVTEPPVPTESRSPFTTSLTVPLSDSVFDGAKPPTSTILVRC